MYWDVRNIRFVAQWRRGEPITAQRANQTVDNLNRIVRLIFPPRQRDVGPVGGLGETVGTGDPLAVGYIRFFSS